MAICAGLGLGLLVHRYAVLPFVVEGVIPKALVWIAFGLLLGARAAYRAGLGTVTAGIVTPARVAIGLVAALVGAGAGFVIAPPLGFAPLRPRPLPGFDVSVPSSASVDAKVESYLRGHLTLEGPAGMAGALSVAWSAGALFNADDVQLTMQTFGAMRGAAYGAAIEAEVAVPEALPSRSWSAAVEEGQIWMTQVMCGARRVQITTAAARGAERLHRRVLGSLRCHPDPAADRSVGDIPVIFELGTGWSRVPNRGNDLQLTDGTDTVFAYTASSLPADKIVEVLTKGMPGLHVGTREGTRWSISVDLDKRSHPGWLRVCDCDRDGQTLIFMWIAGKPDADRARGLQIVQRARCRRIGERPQTWSVAPTDAKVP